MSDVVSNQFQTSHDIKEKSEICGVSNEESEVSYMSTMHDNGVVLGKFVVCSYDINKYHSPYTRLWRVRLLF